jgi:hypothetical protein
MNGGNSKSAGDQGINHELAREFKVSPGSWNVFAAAGARRAWTVMETRALAHTPHPDG